MVEGDGAATKEDEAKGKSGEGKREFVSGVAHQPVVEVDLGDGYGEIDAKGERGNSREQAQENHQSANKFSEGREVGRPSRESEAGDQVSVMVKSAEDLVVTVDEQNRAQGKAHYQKPEGLQTIEVAQVVPPSERKIDYSSGAKEASQTRPSVAVALSGQGSVEAWRLAQIPSASSGQALRRAKNACSG